MSIYFLVFINFLLLGAGVLFVFNTIYKGREK